MAFVYVRFKMLMALLKERHELPPGLIPQT